MLFFYLYFWFTVLYANFRHLLPENKANYKACQPAANNLHLFALSKLFRGLRENTDRNNNRI
jgi:hypothetical protein